MQHIINRGMIDRRSQGPWRPWGSQGRHVLLLNEPEQLREPLSPYHARLGHQGGCYDECTGIWVKYLVENGPSEWGEGHMACFRFEATGAVICSLMTLKLSCPIAS